MADIKRLRIADFLAWAAPHANPDKGPDQWGYVMGATGQTPGTAKELQDLVSRAYGDQWKSYYNSNWIGRRVFDCNGLIEGYYQEMTGTSINTYARYNYRDWCGRKGTIGSLPQMPGVAVFKGSSTGSISHVGFLYQKTGNGPRDWSIIEAKGYMYGVVVTSLAKDSNWKWWGVMDKYFEYESEAALAPNDKLPTLRQGRGLGDPDKDVQYAQERLIAHGEKLPRDGADGEFGGETLAAVKAFQKAKGLSVDGIIGPKTWAALLQDPAKPVIPPAKYYRLTAEGTDRALLERARQICGGQIVEVAIK